MPQRMPKRDDSLNCLSPLREISNTVVMGLYQFLSDLSTRLLSFTSALPRDHRASVDTLFSGLSYYNKARGPRIGKLSSRLDVGEK